MSLDTEFYLKILACFMVSGIFVKIMNIRQRRIEEEAERQYQRTLKLIELRAKIRATEVKK